jgi:hypothetical protein
MLTYCFDLDQTLCLTDGVDYSTSRPIPDRISRVNKLFSEGHRIIIFTARGSVSGLDFTDLTESQLTSWGLRYHSLQFGKPAADYYIDDKAVNSEEFKWRT